MCVQFQVVQGISGAFSFLKSEHFRGIVYFKKKKKIRVFTVWCLKHMQVIVLNVVQDKPIFFSARKQTTKTKYFSLTTSFFFFFHVTTKKLRTILDLPLFTLYVNVSNCSIYSKYLY